MDYQDREDNLTRNLVGAYRPGDLVYGLKGPRDRYLPALVRVWGEGYYCTIDEVNNVWIEHVKAGAWHHIRGSMLNIDPTFFGEEPSNIWGRKSGKKTEIWAYLQYLGQIDKYWLKAAGGDDDDKKRRSCKAAIEYTVINKHVVHFILDNIVIEETIRNQTRLNSGGFTNSELRFIFRKWHEKHISSGVVFYNAGKVVDAPWVRQPAEWANYQKKTRENPSSQPNESDEWLDWDWNYNAPGGA